MQVAWLVLVVEAETGIRTNKIRVTENRDLNKGLQHMRRVYEEILIHRGDAAGGSVLTPAYLRGHTHRGVEGVSPLLKVTEYEVPGADLKGLIGVGDHLL